MKYTKRVVSLFIIATMILSMLSAFIAVPVMAIGDPDVYHENGLWSAEDNLTMPNYYDTKLNVTGTAVTAGETVNIYWDFVQAAYLLNTTTAKNDGTYTCFVDIPSAYNGTHYIWAKDLSTGLSERSGGFINVWSTIILDPDAGLSGDEVTVNGYGFEADSVVEIGIYNASKDKMFYDAADEEKTDDDGAFELTFDIPNWDDGAFTVNCTDNSTSGNLAEDALTIGPALTIDVDAGPSGTVVKVEGRGFGSSNTIYAEDNITMIVGDYAVDTRDGEDFTTSGTGTFTAYIVIPSVPVDTYDINITDGVKWADAEFEVDGEAAIELTPEYGTPGTVLTVKGYNFTQVSGTDVDLTLMGQEAEANTDANGEFTATITVPPLDFGEYYNVTADDEKNIWANETVLVALIVLQMSGYSAPVGSEVTLMGSGFETGGSWNATFGDMELITTQSIGGGSTFFSHVFYVPSVASGTYTIHVYDVGIEITVGIDFTVTDQAELDISRAEIPNGYNLTIEGTNFAELNNTVTEWWIYNSTDAWSIDANITETPGFTPPETDEDGVFIGYYVIPEFLELGSYTINCTTVSNDATDPDITQYAEVDIDIVPEEVILNVGNPSYAKGQTITFVIKATLKKDNFSLGIKDLEGGEVFNSTWRTDDWKTLGSWYYIPSNLQIDDNTAWLYTLPADAEAGTWTYSFWDEDKEYANGTFQVTELTEIEQLQQDIGGIAASVLDLGTSVTDLATSVAGVSGAAADAAAAAATAAAAAADAKTAADSAAAAVADVGDTAEDALDAANDAKSAADAAKTAADSGLAAANDAKATAQTAADAANDAADAAEGAKTAATGLTTLVYGAIGASLIAALAAIVSLMQISRRIAG